MSTQAFVLGGGGFSEGSEPGLEDFLVAQCNSARPRVGFIGTASGDAEGYLLKFYARFSQLAREPSHLPLFRRTPDIAEWIGAQDAIFVGGGNTRSMLALWAAWGVTPLLAEAFDRGTLLAGVSAGAICWFESGVTDSVAGRLGALKCLGLLAGSCCPHYSAEPQRKPTYERLVSTGEIVSGYAIDDGVGVHFVDGAATCVVKGVPSASAYRVALASGRVAAAAIPGVRDVDVS